jgi:hypothetical protein
VKPACWYFKKYLQVAQLLVELEIVVLKKQNKILVLEQVFNPIHPSVHFHFKCLSMGNIAI